MATELSFVLEDRPGGIARIAETLGNVEINIEGIAGLGMRGDGMVRLVVNNAEPAEAALRNAGVQFTRREVLLLNLANKPGELARLTRALADAGVNLTSFYLTMNGRQVLGTENAELAREVLANLGTNAVLV